MSLRYEEAKKLVDKFPHTSKTELGRLLYKRQSLLFGTEKNANWYIRAVTNNNWKKCTGKVSKEYKTDKWKGLS